MPVTERSPLPAERRILSVGRIPPGILGSLETRYVATVAHKFQTIQELMSSGKSTLIDGNYDTVFIASNVPESRRKQIITALSTHRPEVAIYVFTDDAAGYDERWVAIPVNSTADQVAEIIGCTPRQDEPLVVIVMNVKGGVGKSTLAINTAVMLGESGLKVAVLEDDWATGSVQTLLNIPDGRYSGDNLVADIFANEGVVTAPMIAEYLVESNGVHALIGPSADLPENPITVDIAKNILAVMGQDMQFDVIVIDAPPAFIQSSCFTLSVLQNVSRSHRPPLIIVPVIPDKTVMQAVNKTVGIAVKLGQPRSRILPVINQREARQDPESLRGHEIFTGWQPPVTVIPYSPKSQLAGEEGIPLVNMPNENLFGQLMLSVVGMASVQSVRKSYTSLIQRIVEEIEKDKKEKDKALIHAS